MGVNKKTFGGISLLVAISLLIEPINKYLAKNFPNQLLAEKNGDPKPTHLIVFYISVMLVVYGIMWLFCKSCQKGL